MRRLEELLAPTEVLVIADEVYEHMVYAPLRHESVARYPGLRVRIAGGFDEELYRSLRRGEYDFVVAELPRPEDRRGLEAKALASDALGICCRAGHPLARKRRVPLETLLDYPWVLLPRTTRSQRRLEALFASCDLAPRSRWEWSAANELFRAWNGCWTMATSMCV